MKLIDDLCTIESESRGDDRHDFLLSLDKNHFIYRTHFPGNPVTPGACIIQLCKELMERHLGTPLILKKVVNAKFLSIINPVVSPSFQLTLSGIAPVDGGYKFTALVYGETTSFAKISLILQKTASTGKE
ncbi:MAG: 3-hydroxyacyl-ACP dehydratase [Odoribacteraceae bacterium]|jgi:3-hydroxyacyl-[acyl-carrier-protein] dehydratase|nr:3-hydroxyacyl-ACP dehydratase [Odoribacteraceae bacterium]